LDAKIPKAVVSRLSLYLRELQQLLREESKTISSTKLGRRLGFTASQVRKDFAYFGQFGYPGIGYKCEELVAKIRSILGTDRTWPVVLVGCGNLGQALLGYRGFSTQGFEVVAAVDVDESLVGTKIEGLTIELLSSLPKIVTEKQIRVAILAVPAKAADSAVQSILDAGITGILNFAPVTLSLPKNIGLVEVDLARELEQLAFSVLQNGQS
jgi:redox-sensing transcriptional repressor